MISKQNMYKIESDTFMDAGVQGITEFALQLKDLYETLSRTARPEESYSAHNYIEFIAGTGCHIRVMGRLNNKSAYGFTQEINFENEIDQTYLRSFVSRLLSDFGRYKE